MTKKEIVKSISDEIGLTQLKTKEIVQKTFDAIIETLVADHRIELRNFGVFEVKKRAARKARNPRTGERVDVAEKWVVTFKPGKEMEERVRQLAKPPMRRPARPQGLPQRQNRHIKFNFWPPIADLSEEDGNHRRGDSVLSRSRDVLSKVVTRSRNDGSNFREPAFPLGRPFRTRPLSGTSRSISTFRFSN